MCSFLLLSLTLASHSGLIDFANSFQKSRGPDGTHQRRLGDFHLLHNLLSLTGLREAARQPFVQGEVAVLFNGEVYNYRELAAQLSLPVPQTDGEVLLPLYLKYGATFASRLRGEFAICVLDLRRPSPAVVLAVDAFGTKPLWWAVHQQNKQTAPTLAVASYSSPIQRLGLGKWAERLQPNTVLTINFQPNSSKMFQVSRRAVFEFDLRQFKSYTSDWISAFKRAVAKRLESLDGSYRRSPFVPLSSGYDSGALQFASELLVADASLTAEQFPHLIAVRAAEDPLLLASRLNRTRLGMSVRPTQNSFANLKLMLHRVMEPPWAASSYLTPRLLADDAAVALSYICNISRSKGWRVLVSGHGADEVMGSYGRFGIGPRGGRRGVPFPSALDRIFPWRDFFSGAMHDFLMKEELVTGLFGLEGRYPFLDVSVVQEYLWLTAEAKNAYYKAPLHSFFGNNFPFAAGKKLAFQGARNLRRSL